MLRSTVVSWLFRLFKTTPHVYCIELHWYEPCIVECHSAVNIALKVGDVEAEKHDRPSAMVTRSVGFYMYDDGKALTHVT